MKPPAIVAPEVSIAEAKAQVRKTYRIAQDAERAVEAATSNLESKRDAQRRANLACGKALAIARVGWPSRGPNAKGWGDFLRDEGIPQNTALDWMALAGHVEKVSTPNENGVENIPTRAEVRAAKDAQDDEPEIWTCPGCAHRWPLGRDSCWNCHAYSQTNGVPERIVVEEDNELEWTDEQRRAVYEREAQSSAPPRMPVREQKTHAWIEIARDMRALACRWEEQNLHLTDVTTSPDDFMRAKQLAIDVVNRCLAELDAAGVLDKKEGRRQLQLLDGGKS